VRAERQDHFGVYGDGVGEERCGAGVARRALDVRRPGGERTAAMRRPIPVARWGACGGGAIRVAGRGAGTWRGCGPIRAGGGGRLGRARCPSSAVTRGATAAGVSRTVRRGSAPARRRTPRITGTPRITDPIEAHPVAGTAVYETGAAYGTGPDEDITGE
jgi:hypothetical protein